MSPRALGIDLGTTATKVVVMDEDGHVSGRGSARHELPGTAAPGRVEIDPERWFDSLRRALAFIDPGELGRLDVIGITGNMSSVLLVDRSGRSDGPGILLADTRGAEEIAALPEDLATRIRQVSGNEPATVFSLSTLLWLARRYPARLDSTVFCAAKDWLRIQLCNGPPESDVTDASNTLLLSKTTRDWDRELAGQLGIPQSALPPLRGSSEILGAVSERTSDITGIPRGTPVVTGGGDMACLALGAGLEATRRGGSGKTALVSLGTSMTVLLPVAYGSNARAGTTWHPLFDEGSAFELCSLVTGGLALNWLSALTGTELSRLPAHALAADDPLVMVPHLAGSAFPEMRPDIRGAVIGLSPTTDSTDLSSALFEALAFELHHVLGSAEDIDDVLLTGGGVRVPGLVAAIAESIPVPTRVAYDAEASARGAALLGLRGIGSPDSALAMPGGTLVEVDQPRADRRRARQERYFAARELIFHQNNYEHECDGQA